MEQFLHETIRAGGDIAKKYFDTDVKTTEKSDWYNLLTEADIAVNKFVTDRIKEVYPDHAITSEEEDFVDGSSEFEWILDPIDGTYNYAHGTSCWGTHLSVLKNDVPLYSAVYFPLTNQLFYANESGAFKNGVRLQVEQTQVALSDSIGKGYALRMDDSTRNEHTKIVEQYKTAHTKYVNLPNTSIRHAGGSCELVLMAVGYVHLAYGNGGYAWDYIPPFHILEKAGAIITNAKGEPWERGQHDFVIAINKALHTELLELFND